jgi:hypothetical protein
MSMEAMTIVACLTFVIGITGYTVSEAMRDALTPGRYAANRAKGKQRRPPSGAPFSFAAAARRDLWRLVTRTEKDTPDATQKA